MQQTEADPSVLEYLSFEADQTTQESMIPTTPVRPSEPNGTSRSAHLQGILWKRRDVFRNRWRPRWFVLHPDQRLLTYYLLANQETEQVVSGGSVSTPGRRRPATGYGTPSSPSTPIGSDTIGYNNGNQASNRTLSLSESSSVSVNTIDCDVVPRGTIYLLGSTVEANEALTSPQEALYTFTITDHENSTHCHLAARTVECRDQWIHSIRRVCQRENQERNQGQEESSILLDSSRSIHVIQSRRILYPPQSTESTTIDAMNGTITSGNSDKNDPSWLGHINGNRAAGESVSSGINSSSENEILLLFAPIFLYRFLTMMSLFKLAALCFVATSAMVVRWVLVRYLFMVVRPLTGKHQDGSRRLIMPIGCGSICCRFTEDLTDIATKGSEISLSHILVWSLSKAILEQPLLASKKLSFLPSFYSTDVVYHNLDENPSDGSHCVWVSKADEKDLSEITKSFITAKERKEPVSLFQLALGPACRVVMTSSTKGDYHDSRKVNLGMNLIDCPITVFISCATPSKGGIGQETDISITFQSTNINECRKFVKNFRRSFRSAEICAKANDRLD